MNIRLPLIIFACAALASACASGAQDIPSDLPPSKIIQRAQEASDRSKYRQALEYYNVLIERYPNNTDLRIAAEYEIAFIHYKQKKYEQSKGEFKSLLSRYAQRDAELLPQQYKILSEKVLGQIEEMQSRNKPKPKT